MNNIQSVYEKHKNLKLAANELGVKWQTLYVQLRNRGVPITGDKSRYGSDKDRLAARAELKTRNGHRIITKIKCRDFGA